LARDASAANLSQVTYHFFKTEDKACHEIRVFLTCLNMVIVDKVV
jgi:hypothetical protein